MANINALNEANGSGQADISVVLDTLMYCDSDAFKRGNYEGETLETIVTEMLKDNQLKGDNRDAVLNVKKYLDSPNGSEAGQLILSSTSANMGDGYEGAYGATFYKTNSSGSKDVYVAFKGTGDGRWYDNGDAFSKENSPYQRQAAAYFDKAMEDLGVDSTCNVVTTGHSKGGNMAQYVTLASKNAYLVDQVISLDGQGFSPEAVAYFKELYGEEFYKEQCEKMYSICGDNDFVNVLGIKVIPDDHTVYIKTPTDVTDVPNAHALYDGEKANFFDYEKGCFYDTTLERRTLSKTAQELSEYIMTLPADEREAICRTIMTALEYSMGGVGVNLLTGLHGEKATAMEWIETLTHLDDIVDKILRSESVQDFIDDTVNGWIKNIDSKIYDLPLPFPVCLAISTITKAGIHVGVAVLEATVYALSKIIATGAKVAKAVVKAYEFCKKAVGIFKNLIKQLSPAHRAAVRYMADNKIICCNTDELRGLADRLAAINGRLSNLDREIDSLYWKVKWTDLLALQRADFKISYSTTLKKCMDYMYDTARRFEQAENKVLEMFR